MIRTDIALPIKYNNEIICEAIAAHLGFPAFEITETKIMKRTLELSGAKPFYRATVAFAVGEEREQGLLKMRKKISQQPDYSYTPPTFRGNFRPVVVGAGPAGLFAALTLAEAGANPIILERGLPVEKRGQKVELFARCGILDPECNIQFGEGGAGTYSDGKLKVGSMDKYKMKVLSELISSGATDDIAFSSTAHLGTDRLPRIVRAIRERIISLGGEFNFSARLTNILLSDGEVSGVVYEQDGEKILVQSSAVILAVGHSARDTLRMLYEKGVRMTPKGFGIGVRIEHPREYIDRIVYREHVPFINETASYHLVTHLPSGRSVYSFCMCPGGTVVAATSSPEGVVTNGMSELARKGDNSNAALLVSVTPGDFGSPSPLAGIDFQSAIEKTAYSLTSGYRAPAQRLCDFMRGECSASFGDTKPSYPRGTEFLSAESYLPEFVTQSLRAAIGDFDSWMRGFYYGDAVMTGPETRTTSPIRIERDESYSAIGIHGLYPAGEGAGYAGGIVSSATDGIRAAEKLILAFCK